MNVKYQESVTTMERAKIATADLAATAYPVGPEVLARSIEMNARVVTTNVKMEIVKTYWDHIGASALMDGKEPIVRRT